MTEKALFRQSSTSRNQNGHSRLQHPPAREKVQEEGRLLSGSPIQRLRYILSYPYIPAWKTPHLPYQLLQRKSLAK